MSEVEAFHELSRAEARWLASARTRLSGRPESTDGTDHTRDTRDTEEDR